MAVPNLAEISGKFNADGRYKLDWYNIYLTNLTSFVKELQSNIKIIATEFRDTVMVENKWYDDSAAEFAKWWNDVAGQKDGIDCLNKISSIVEELVRITAVNVCTQMKQSAQTKNSYQNYPYIVKYAKGDVYVEIENINKKMLGMITTTECKTGVTIEANKAALTSMVSSVSNAFKIINENLDKIESLITSNLIQGKAISFSGFDSNLLKRKINAGKSRLEEIQTRLYSKLLEDQEASNLTTKELKAALTTNFIKR